MGDSAIETRGPDLVRKANSLSGLSESEQDELAFIKENCPHLISLDAKREFSSDRETCEICGTSL